MPLHLESVMIGAFRGLADAELAGLGRVNVLVGVNDSGKTSVLEALHLLCSPLEMERWHSVAVARTRHPDRGLPEHLRWLFAHEPGQVLDDRYRGRMAMACSGGIHLRGFKAEIEEVLRMQGGAPAVRGAAVKVRTAAGTDEHSLQAQAEFQFWPDQISVASTADEKRLLASRLVMPYEHWWREIPVDEFSRARIAQSGDIGALLKSIDPRIAGIEVLTTRGTPDLYARDQAGPPVPLTEFGDGIRRILMLAAVVTSASGGVLLIDEIETAIHVSALARVFGWLVEACVERDVQLFVTTHSLEAIDAMLAAERRESTVGFRLERADGRIAVRRMPEDVLRRLLFERGLDVR